MTMILLIILGIGYAVTGEVVIDVSIAPDYHSCTVALDLRQDYYLEYENGVLVNMTPLDEPIILTKEMITCD